MVIASDNDGIRFEQNVLPSQMVTFSGSKKNEKFSGTHVKILVNGVLDAMLGTFCNDLIIGDQYGSFAAVTGGSKSGSKVCCVQTETDKTLPVITNCPATLFANTLDGCHASVRWTPPSFSDNCSISEVVSSHASGDTFAVGSTEVTYTATDNAGNTVSCSFSVVVTDESAPIFSRCPSEDLVATAGESCGAMLSWTPPVVSDNCSYTVTSNFNPGDLFPIGSTIVTYIATDDSGNVSTCSFNVVVRDEDAPQFKCISNVTVTIRANSNCEGRLDLNPVVLDCSEYTLTMSHDANSIFPIGETTVNFSAVDIHGNRADCSFVITVEDYSAPMFVKCPSSIRTKAVNETTVKWEQPTLVEGCSQISLTASHEPGSSFHCGITPVEYVARNASGRVASCQFDVIVLEELDFTASDLVTPDGDGFNDRWVLSNIESFKDNLVLIVDRWGNPVFRASGYNNENVVWQGTTLTGTRVPTGTYFYTVTVRRGIEVVRKTGSIELIN
jgi:gliding motility-associated-like protein